MNKKSIIRNVYFVFIFILFSTLVSAYDFNDTSNESVSYTGYYNLTMSSSTNNNTVFFWFYEDQNMTDETNRLELLYYINNSIYFNESGVVKDSTILISIPDVGLVNHTYYVKINSTNSNVTENKTVFIKVLPFVEEEPIWYNIDTDEYQLVMCNYRLPVEFEKEVTIGGEVGQIVYISKSITWFNISKNATIGDNQYTTIDIRGNIPEDTQTGIYTEYVYFDFGNNNSDEIKFIFEVEDCGIIVNWNDYVIDCDDEKEANGIDSPEYQYCMMDASARYNQDWLENYHDINRTQTINVTQNVTVEVPVEVMRLNGYNFQAIIDASNTINNGKDIFEKRFTDLEQDNTDLRQINKEMINTIQNLPFMINETATGMVDEVLKSKKAGKIWFWVIFWIVVLCLICYGFYYMYKENTIY